MTAPQRSLQANSRGIAVLITAVVIGFILLAQASSAGGGGGDDDGDAAPVSTTTEAETTTTTDAEGNADDPEGDDGEEGEEGEGEGQEDPEGEEGEDEGEDAETGDVQVSVLNASGVTGLAATTMEEIADAGYQEGFVGNATGTDETGIFYREGHQAEAAALASLFGQPDSVVEALSTPFEGTSEDDVVIVVLGADFEG